VVVRQETVFPAHDEGGNGAVCQIQKKHTGLSKHVFMSSYSMPLNSETVQLWELLGKQLEFQLMEFLAFDSNSNPFCLST
jgi:hypothetical protein